MRKRIRSNQNKVNLRALHDGNDGRVVYSLGRERERDRAWTLRVRPALEIITYTNLDNDHHTKDAA